MSFLTWAFVLAEMVGRDAFLPTAAHAGDGEGGQSSHHPSDVTPIANNLPNIDVSTATDSPEPITYQHAAPMPAYAADGAPSELSAAKVIPAADLGPDLHSGSHWGGGGGPHAEASGAEGDGNPAHALGSLLDQPFVAAIGHDGLPIDLGLHLDVGDAVQGLLGDVTDTLGSLPLVGHTLGEVGDTLSATTSTLLNALNPVVSLVGLGGSDPFHLGNNLGLPGQLQFAAGGDAAGSSELVSTLGNYTSYGIALSIGSTHDDPVSNDASTHAEASGLLGLDVHIGADLPGSDIHAGSDALHLDQTILKTAADVLA